MTRRLPPLNWVRTFEAAARHLSFTRAGRELGVTQAAVSQQVKALEQHLGLALFRRTRNQLFLTYAGQAWLPKLTVAFNLIESGIESARIYDPGGLVTVRLPSSFSIQWLTPRLERFHHRYPHIEVRIAALGRRGDAATAADLEIRNGLAPPPGIDAVLLLREEVFPVCSPGLLERGLVRPGDAGSLAAQTLLHVDGYPEDWPAWFAAAGLRAPPPVAAGLHFDQSVTAIQAALNGIGVALGRSALVGRELATGRLVRPVDLRLQAKDAYWIVAPREAGQRANVVAFRDWLIEEAGEAPGN